MRRIICNWTGPAVKGLAVTVLHFDEGETDITAKVGAFFNAIKGHLPSNTTVTVPNSGDVIAESTGALTGAWTSPSPVQTVTGLINGTVAAGVGACITWRTNGIVRRSRVRGRTFIVPLPTAGYATDGTLDDAFVTALKSAATALHTGNGMSVWSRPSTPGGTDGSSHSVLTSSVRDRVAVLRSRRD